MLVCFYFHLGTTGLSRPLSIKTLGRSSLSKASGAKSVSKMSGEEESLEKCAQTIVENCVSTLGCFCLVVQVTAILEIRFVVSFCLSYLGRSMCLM